LIFFSNKKGKTEPDLKVRYGCNVSLLAAERTEISVFYSWLAPQLGSAKELPEAVGEIPIMVNRVEGRLRSDHAVKDLPPASQSLELGDLEITLRSLLRF
jgi:hypothetical protein